MAAATARWAAETDSRAGLVNRSLPIEDGTEPFGIICRECRDDSVEPAFGARFRGGQEHRSEQMRADEGEQEHIERQGEAEQAASGRARAIDRQYVHGAPSSGSASRAVICAEASK